MGAGGWWRRSELRVPALCTLCLREEERRERLTTNDALSYLREVKTRFSTNRKVYDRCGDRPPDVRLYVGRTAVCWPGSPPGS